MTSGLRGFTAGEPSTFNLAAALSNGPVVLHFFPGAKTASCNIETHIFSEGTDQFTAQKATLVGITAGNIYKVADYSKDTEYCAGKFPLLADPGTKIAKQDDSLLGMNPEWSDRASCAISPDGPIVHVHSDLKADGHVAETLDAVKAWAAAK